MRRWRRSEVGDGFEVVKEVSKVVEGDLCVFFDGGCGGIIVDFEKETVDADGDGGACEWGDHTDVPRGNVEGG